MLTCANCGEPIYSGARSHTVNGVTGYFHDEDRGNESSCWYTAAWSGFSVLHAAR